MTRRQHLPDPLPVGAILPEVTADLAARSGEVLAAAEPRRRPILSTAGRDCLLPDMPIIRLAIAPVIVEHPAAPDTYVRLGSICEGVTGPRVLVCRLAGRPGGCPLPGRDDAPDTRTRTHEEAAEVLLIHYTLHHPDALTGAQADDKEEAA